MKSKIWFKKIILLISIFFILPGLLYAGYYFRDDFNTLDTNAWYPDFFMAREGRINLYNATYQTVIDANGTLNYSDIVYSANGYDGAWGGTGVILSNVKYTTSPNDPVGAELNITSWQILNNGPSPSVEMADFGLWMVEDVLSSVTLYTEEYQNFNSKVMVYYTTKNGTIPNNFWGILVGGSDFKLDLENAIRPDGSTIDLSSFHDLVVNVTGNELINTNISVKLINTGEKIYVYFNPNPNNSNNNGFPQEFCLVGTYPVLLDQNIRFYINEEVRNKNSYCDPRFEYFYIKSTADSFSPSMTKGSQVATSTNYDFELTLANSISPSNSGINVVTVEKPSAFGNWVSSNLTNEIKILTGYDGGTAKSNVVRSFSAYSNLATNECAVQTNGDELWIRFGKQISSTFGDKDIIIKFSMDTPTNGGTYTFDTTVEGVLFDPSLNQTNYSTCGPQKNSCTVKVISSKLRPYAFGSIEDDDGDNTIISGAPSYTFTYTIETSGVTNEDADTLSQIFIRIPNGFNISLAESMVLIDSNQRCVSYVTNPSEVSTNGIFIKIDYSKDKPTEKKIAAQDGIDIIKIVVSQATQIGTFNWPSWVVGTMGDTSQVKTNIVNLRQDMTVIGANPKVRFGIYTPSVGNPRILFNTMKSNEIQIEIENTATDPANKINVVIITIPAFFTNITGITSQRVSSANIKLYKAPLGNESSITLIYANEGKYIPPFNQVDIVTFNTFHNIPPLSGSSGKKYFSVVVNNSNGAGYVPVSTMGKVTNIEITDPQPSGSASIEPADGTVYTSDITNDFTYQLVNSAPLGSGADILFVEISIPTNYFVKVTNTTSVKAPGGVSNYDNKILINYTDDGNLVPGQADTIAFTLIDKYTNIPVPDNVLIESKVFNLTKTNYTTDYSPKDRNVYFIPQEARADAWTVTKNFLSEISTFTLYYSMSNCGDPGNKIDRVQIYFTNTFINIPIGNVTNQFPSAIISYLGGPMIDIDYSAINFDSGMKDTIRIIGDYLAVGMENTYNIQSSVTVNTSTLAPAHIKTNENVTIHFEIPFPSADVHITPNIVFTSSVPEINYMQYYITNTGAGANDIARAEILVPALYWSKVSIVTSTFINDQTAISNKSGSGKLILSYISDSSNFLKPGDKDIVTIAITNSITSVENVLFDCELYNLDKNKPAATKSGWSKMISIVGQPDGYILLPSNIESASITNDLTYRIKNSDTGKPLIESRIAIPAGFTVISNTIDGSWASANYSLSNGYIWADYSANDLDPGGIDEISFKVTDTYTKTNVYVPWLSQIQYYAYDIFYSTGTNLGSQNLSIRWSDAVADGYLFPNQSFVKSGIVVSDFVTNDFTYIITNTGEYGNDIREARIYYPTNYFQVINESSGNLAAINVIVTNDYIRLRYDQQGDLLVEEKDTITFDLVYDLSTTATFTLFCKVDSGSGYLAETTSSGGSQILDMIESTIRASVEIVPDAIDCTDITNIFTYSIKNMGGTGDKIYSAKIIIPSHVTNVANINSIIPSSISNYNNNYILIDYASQGTNISSGTNDKITFRAIDDIDIDFGATNLIWDAQAHFSNELGYIRAEGTKNVDIRSNNAVADGYLFPNQSFVKSWIVVSDSITNDFAYTIENTGEYGNDIREARIYYPTNFQVINESSSNLAAINVIVESNYIRLRYDQQGDLLVGQKDTITFDLVYDIPAITTFTLFCKVDNGSGYLAETTSSGGSKILDIIESTVMAYVEIDPNEIDCTDITNIFTYSIENMGGSGDKIYSAKIIMPSNVTNVANINSTIPSSISNYNNNYILIDYASQGTNISSGIKDTITFRAIDDINYGASNLIWDAHVHFSNELGYIHTLGTKNVEIRSKDAVADAYLFPNESFVKSGIVVSDFITNDFTYVITNTGEYGNDILEARIYYPTNYLQVINESSSNLAAINVIVESNYIRLRYDQQGDLLVGEKDTITFDLVYNIPTKTTFTLSCRVDNGSGYLVETTSFVGSQILDIIESTIIAYVEIKPNGIDCTDITNTFAYDIENMGGTDDKIYSAKIIIPTHVTNVANINTTILGTSGISNYGTYILIDYASQGTNISSGTKDTITFRAIDDINYGASNLIWDAHVHFSNELGYIHTQGAAKNVLLSIPYIEAEALLLPPLTIPTSTNIVTDTIRTIEYEIKNKGVGNNKLYEAEIRLPVIFSNCIVSVSNSWSTNNTITNSKTGPTNIIKIYYTNNPLPAKSSDIITIILNDFKITKIARDNKFICTARNIRTNFESIGIEYIMLDIESLNPYQFKAELAEDSRVIYTLDKLASLKYQVWNNSFEEKIEKVVIDFDFTLFSNVRISSSILGTNCIITNSSTDNITLDYTSCLTNMSLYEYDTVEIQFDYDIANLTTKTLGCKVQFETSSLSNFSIDESKLILSVELAYWGTIIGNIRPNRKTTLTIYKAGTSTIAANFGGISAFYTAVEKDSEMTSFVIDRLPPGVYDIEVQTAGYKTSKYFENITVNTDKITDAGLAVLNNAMIEEEATSERKIACLDDGEASYIIFPVGSALEDFYIDIYKRRDPERVNASSRNDTISPKPKAPDKMYIFHFELFDAKEEPLEEIEIGDSITVVLHYTDEEIALQGWNEGSLAIYYYKENTGEWVKLGGKIDKEKNTITIQVNYLHATYAIFGTKEVTYVKIYGDLKCWPNPFTPGRGGNIYENMKVSCIFKKDVQDFQFKVYDLMGRAIRTIEYKGTFTQAEIYWDGKDDDGYFAKSGVYIFQIETGSEYYRGRAIIIK